MTTVRATVATSNGHTPREIALDVSTIAEFTEKEEEGSAAVIGSDGDALIPEGGDVMIYGDGGAGKTTLTIDLACNLAAGSDWLEIPIARPTNVLLIENEGPRPLFRKKLKSKLAAWAGPPLGDRLNIVESPW